MEYSKENLKEEYNKLKEHIGKPPSSRIFYKETGISRRKIETVFGSSAFTKLVQEAGGSPNVFSTEKIELSEILLQWGNLTRKIGKLPVIAEWQCNGCKPEIGNIKRTHGLKWNDIPYAFLENYSSKSEWIDVIELIPSKTFENHENEKGELVSGTLEYKYQKFLPPIVANLIDLSYDKEKFKEFEKQVNQVFHLLGFDVIEYGQGTGRNPDGIAKDPENRYAIIIDSKTRKNGYKIGTDDRTFIEYIRTYQKTLANLGFQTIYLIIVSSQFESTTDQAIINIKLETNVSTSLISSRSLLKILASKIENPRLFELKKFQKLLINTGEITEKRIDEFLKQIK
ncbi:MAG: restriction endonuclease FokI C-terminal domain-containing protein [Bacteroidales bacterium]